MELIIASFAVLSWAVLLHLTTFDMKSVVKVRARR